MAFDVITRPDDGCLTVVHDRPGLVVTSLEIGPAGDAVARSSEGEIAVGRLLPSMLDEAARCGRAVAVAMDGWRVADARAIDLVVDRG